MLVRILNCFTTFLNMHMMGVACNCACLNSALSHKIRATDARDFLGFRTQSLGVSLVNS